jgi:pimeloyl-ACP methyl ester carboxylesterase
MRDKGIKQELPTLVDRWFTDEFAEANPKVIEQRLQQVLDTPEQVFLNVFDIYASTEMAPWLHEVTAPCLVLTGELDGGCNPRLNRFIASELPDAELVVLDGLKHSILIEASDRVAPYVRSFLSKR